MVALTLLRKQVSFNVPVVAAPVHLRLFVGTEPRQGLLGIDGFGGDDGRLAFI